MKKVLILALVIFVTVGFSAVTPVLFETYQEGTVTVQPGGSDSVLVVDLTFSVDSSCYVHFSVGGLSILGRFWLELDGEKQVPEERLAGTSHVEGFNMDYSYLLSSGEHNLSLKITSHFNQTDSTTCEQAYLQALIFLPDETDALAERPDGDADELGDGVSSVISRGPYVTVTGATELVDATGRVIENAIEDDRVSINNLSQGTYYARKEGNTLVKIVKVD